MGAGTAEAESGNFAGNGEFFAAALDLDAGNPIDEACRGVLFGIRLGTANPVINHKVDKVLVLEKRVATNGSSVITRMLGASLTVNTDATVALTGMAADILRDSDLGQGLTSETETVSEQGTFAFTGTDGRVTVEFGDAKLEGWMSADGSVGVLRLHSSAIAVDGDASLGMVILIEQK